MQSFHCYTLTEQLPAFSDTFASHPSTSAGKHNAKSRHSCSIHSRWQWREALVCYKQTE